MKIVENGYNTEFQIKICGKYITIASLVRWFYSKHFHKYNLFFYYYGKEFEKGEFANEHINGNVKITMWMEEDELWEEFIERVKNVVYKKLYIIGNSILEEIRYLEE